MLLSDLIPLGALAVEVAGKDAAGCGTFYFSRNRSISRCWRDDAAKGSAPTPTRFQLESRECEAP